MAKREREEKEREKYSHTDLIRIIYTRLICGDFVRADFHQSTIICHAVASGRNSSRSRNLRLNLQFRQTVQVAIVFHLTHRSCSDWRQTTQVHWIKLKLPIPQEMISLLIIHILFHLRERLNSLKVRFKIDYPKCIFYVRFPYRLLIKKLLVITRQSKSLESLSVLNGKRLIVRHPLKIEIAGWIWMRGYRSATLICKGFRDVYFVYDPVFERIRKLDQRHSTPLFFSLFFIYPEPRSDRCINVSLRWNNDCDDTHLHANGNALTAFFSFLFLVIISFFYRHRVPRIYALFYSGIVKLSALITLVDKRALFRTRISARALDTRAFSEVMGPPGVLTRHACLPLSAAEKGISR